MAHPQGAQYRPPPPPEGCRGSNAHLTAVASVISSPMSTTAAQIDIAKFVDESGAFEQIMRLGQGRDTLISGVEQNAPANSPSKVAQNLRSVVFDLRKTTSDPQCASACRSRVELSSMETSSALGTDETESAFVSADDREGTCRFHGFGPAAGTGGVHHMDILHAAGLVAYSGTTSEGLRIPVLLHWSAMHPISPMYPHAYAYSLILFDLISAPSSSVCRHGEGSSIDCSIYISHRLAPTRSQKRLGPGCFFPGRSELRDPRWVSRKCTHSHGAFQHCIGNFAPGRVLGTCFGSDSCCGSVVCFANKRQISQ